MKISLFGFNLHDFYFGNGSVVVIVIVWQLDLQLPVQSVPITTEVVNSNPFMARNTRYNIM